ncbi:hypothetical protein GCM10020331_071980 [Ectobacillus funiculus]
MIAHNQRFVASHQKKQDSLLKAEKSVKSIASVQHSAIRGLKDGARMGKKAGSSKKRKKAFIGAMGDLGVHKTDLLRYVLGEEITEVGAFIETSAKSFADVDDTAVCVLKNRKRDYRNACSELVLRWQGR